MKVAFKEILFYFFISLMGFWVWFRNPLIILYTHTWWDMLSKFQLPFGLLRHPYCVWLVSSWFSTTMMHAPIIMIFWIVRQHYYVEVIMISDQVQLTLEEFFVLMKVYNQFVDKYVLQMPKRPLKKPLQESRSNGESKTSIN